jgi:hypothetical protein
MCVGSLKGGSRDFKGFVNQDWPPGRFRAGGVGGNLKEMEKEHAAPGRPGPLQDGRATGGEDGAT